MTGSDALNLRIGQQTMREKLKEMLRKMYEEDTLHMDDALEGMMPVPHDQKSTLIHMAIDAL